jgi:hypothetical protein
MHKRGFHDWNSNHDSFKTHPGLVDIMLLNYNEALSELFFEEKNKKILQSFCSSFTNKELPDNKFLTSELLVGNPFSLI